MESLIVKFDQEKFEEFLSSSFASKTMRHHRKVSSGTRSRISLEISPEVARTPANSASNATSNEVLKTSRVAYVIHVNVSEETHRANASVHDQSNSEDQSRHHTSFQTLQFQVAEGSQQLLRLKQNTQHQ